MCYVISKVASVSGHGAALVACRLAGRRSSVHRRVMHADHHCSTCVHLCQNRLQQGLAAKTVWVDLAPAVRMHVKDLCSMTLRQSFGPPCCMSRTVNLGVVGVRHACVTGGHCKRRLVWRRGRGVQEARVVWSRGRVVQEVLATSTGAVCAEPL